MAKEKKMISVFVVDGEGLEDVMDIHGIADPKPQTQSWACVYEGHPAIGDQLLIPKDGEVFQIEDVEEAMEKYKKPKKVKKAPKKKGDYDSKVMKPSK